MSSYRQLVSHHLRTPPGINICKFNLHRLTSYRFLLRYDHILPLKTPELLFLEVQFVAILCWNYGNKHGHGQVAISV